MFKKGIRNVVKKSLPKDETLIIALSRKNNEDGVTRSVARIEVDMDNAQDLITWFVDTINTYERSEP